MQGQRLREAREARNLTAQQVYDALGIAKSTYEQYENGRLGLSQVAVRLANFLRTNLEWLLTGKGLMRGARSDFSIPIRGIVGAGGLIDTLIADEINGLGDMIDLPPIESLGALLVKGDSQRPRFFDGEYVIFKAIPRRPDELVGEFAVVETRDGRSMIKLLRHGRQDGTFNLESVNADTEENVEIDCAYEHVLTIPTRKRFALRITPHAPIKPKQ